MGMTASQARFLSLTARKNNVEFEGQQINQQRTTLSNESASYYSELCNMSVPTPPSVDDYTKVSYTFNDGALTNTVTSMIAKGNNQYSISYIQQWQDDYSIVSASSSLISKENNTYKVGTTELRALGSINGKSAADIKNMTTADFDALKLGLSNDKYLSTLEQDQLADLLEQEEYYQKMLNENKFNNPNSGDEWYVRYVKDTTKGNYVPYFYQKDEVEDPDKYNQGYAVSTINCYSIGSSTKTKRSIESNRYSRKRLIRQIYFIDII